MDILMCFLSVTFILQTIFFATRCQTLKFWKREGPVRRLMDSLNTGEIGNNAIDNQSNISVEARRYTQANIGGRKTKVGKTSHQQKLYGRQSNGKNNGNVKLMQEDKGRTKSEKLTHGELKDLSPYAIHRQMKQLIKNNHGLNVSVEVIGRTIEYNDIVMLKIAANVKEIPESSKAQDDKYIKEEDNKKIIFIVHGLSLMGIKKIPSLSSFSGFKNLLNMYLEHLDKFDIYLIPMANPDGFGDIPPHYLINSATTCWNKNLSPQAACSGVDLDRNFDIYWNISDIVNSCNPHYPGPYAFSELESQAVRDVFRRHSHKIVAYIHVHSASCHETIFKGDAVLYPNGYVDTATDEDKYVDMKANIDEAIRNAGFEVLSVFVDTLYNWYGKVSGTSVDYASTVYGVPYALEFLMQPYSDETKAIAISEIWKRIINSTFNDIYMSTVAVQENNV